MRTALPVLLFLVLSAPALADSPAPEAAPETAPAEGSAAPAAEPVAPAAEPAPPERRGGLLRRPKAAPQSDRAPAGSAANAAASDATEAAEAAPQMDSRVSRVKYDRKLFRPDPGDPNLAYDPEAQRIVYGGKHRLRAPRPLLELGYPMYSEGEFGTGFAMLGSKNLVRPQLLVFGDWRGVAALNDDGGTLDGVEKGGDGKRYHGLFATRLNLDVDLKLTATERFHFLFRPLDRKGKFTRYEWQGGVRADGKGEDVELNGNVVNGFFEGDLGAMLQGLTGHYNHLDLPFAVGFVPLLFQNGVWMDDAVIGGAFTIPAMNSRIFDISNFDVTVFAGFDKVSNRAIPVRNNGNEAAQVYGVATFLDVLEGYLEGGYGYMRDRPAVTGGVEAPDRSFHSVTAAFTRRYGGWLSNSVRVIGSVGQRRANVAGLEDFTANGVILLLENSLIGRRPYTLLPYFNLFVAEGTPQSLARDPGAGGILKNTGINFETDNLTGFPKLDDTAQDAYGGALGLEYLFNLDQQLVFEVAGLGRTHGPKHDTADYGFGVRWQLPFWRQWIVRADGIVGRVNDGGGNAARHDISGVRLELRLKF